MLSAKYCQFTRSRASWVVFRSCVSEAMCVWYCDCAVLLITPRLSTFLLHSTLAYCVVLRGTLPHCLPFMRVTYKVDTAGRRRVRKFQANRLLPGRDANDLATLEASWGRTSTPEVRANDRYLWTVVKDEKTLKDTKTTTTET